MTAEATEATATACRKTAEGLDRQRVLDIELLKGCNGPRGEAKAGVGRRLDGHTDSGEADGGRLDS